jgi:hypothetical protein
MEHHIEGMEEHAQVGHENDVSFHETNLPVEQSALRPLAPEERKQDLVAQAYELDPEFGEELSKRPDLQEKILQDRDAFMEMVRTSLMPPPDRSIN